jgi:hypothetical protein
MVLLASNFDKSKYLRATDLDKEMKFKIKSATDEVVGTGDDKEHRLIIGFTNDERGLVLNRTNRRILREAFGDVVDSWIGKVIAVYPTSVDFRGKLVPALRVRIPPPKQPAAATSPQPASSGAAAAPPPKASAAPADPELVDEPQKPLREELDDEIPF